MEVKIIKDKKEETKKDNKEINNKVVSNKDNKAVVKIKKVNKANKDNKINLHYRTHFAKWYSQFIGKWIQIPTTQLGLVDMFSKLTQLF